MARGGMRVLCLEKNHFIGGMASTNELVRGYRFELAGSIQFPIPTEIFDDLGFASCPIYEPEVQSASIGTAGQPPILLYSDPERLLEHLSEVLGLEAVLGMAEVAGWAEAPGPGHRTVRRAQAAEVARRDVGVRVEREGAPGHPHRHVRQRHGRGRPVPARPGAPRPGPQHAGLPVGQLHLPGAVRRREARCASPSPWPPRPMPPCPRCAAASAPCPTTCWAVRDSTAASSAATSRSPTIVVSDGTGPGRGPGRRRGGHAHRSWCPTSTPPPPSPSSSTARRCPTPSPGGSTPSTTGPPTSRCTSPSNGLPEFAGPYEVLNDGDLRQNVTFFGTAEQMQRRLRGLRPRPRAPVAVVQPGHLDPPRSRAGASGQARRQHLRLLRPDRRRPCRAGAPAGRDGRAHRGHDHRQGTQLPRPHRAADQLSRPTPTS